MGVHYHLISNKWWIDFIYYLEYCLDPFLIFSISSKVDISEQDDGLRTLITVTPGQTFLQENFMMKNFHVLVCFGPTTAND